MGPNPSIAHNLEADAKYREKALDIARTYFEPQLEARGLGKEQIAKQTLGELELSLQKIDDAISLPESFTFPGAGSLKFWVVEVNPREMTRAYLYTVLLERKSQILQRMSLLRPQGQLSDLKEVVQAAVDDPNLRNSLLVSIQDGVSKAIAEANAIQTQVTDVDRERQRVELDIIYQERQDDLQERRSRRRKSWFERESIASIVGAVLLLGLGITLIIAMFTGTAAPEIVTSAFLLILGYFFGQTADRGSGESSKSTSP